MQWILVLILAVAAVAFFISFNRLVRMRQLVRNAWSDVDVYLKRRAELIPNLVAAVKGYTQHEQSTLETTIAARDQALGAGSLSTRAEAERQVGGGLSRVMLLAESYPELKASQNFLELQRSLSETEKLIASARQYYNACVRDYNTLIEAFPSNIPAGLFQFKPAEFFELEDVVERDTPRLEGLS